MAYWNRYDEEDEQGRDFESGSRYEREQSQRRDPRNQSGSQRQEYDRMRQWRRGSGRGSEREGGRDPERGSWNESGRGGQDRDRNYPSSGDRYAQNYQTPGSEERDWDYGYPRDYGQNRDYRRDYQQDYDSYGDYRRGSQQGYDPQRGSRQNYQHGGSQDRGRYEHDQYNRYNISGYNDEEEYYGLGYRPTNYNPHHPNRMPGREIPVAGMQSDFGGNTDYDNPNSGRSSYQRGDIGYENEGAFYQDMDEPVNNDFWPSRQDRYQHVGKGPANFRRSDSRIQEDIYDRLTLHGRIDATDIEVSVNDGVAVLKGAVPSRDMKRLAEDVAADITGVKDVENQIRVNQQQEWGSRSRYQDLNYQRSQQTGWSGETGSQRGSQNRADISPAGETNLGAGLTSAGATSLEGMEAGEEVGQNQRGLREGMEVVGRDGKVVGRVKELRTSDFLLDREMARDLYVPYSALQSVGAQAMLGIQSYDLENQGWDKPAIL